MDEKNKPMSAKKTKYLSYVEEHRKHHSVIDRVAKNSSQWAIENSHAQSVPVTYLDGDVIVREAKSGKKVTVGHVRAIRRKVKVGAKTRLSKK